MTKEDYEKAKKEIFDKASKRAERIKEKYDNNPAKRNFDGILDGEPWAKELHEDSKKTLKELKELDNKYNK